MDNLGGKVLEAHFLHAPQRGEVAALSGALIAVGADGRIGTVTAPDAPEFPVQRAEAAAAGRLVSLPPHCFVLPGFVDCHVHAPQYPQAGAALDVPLEVWLTRYTFPLEARYADLAFARRAYEALVADLLALGTTTALYFATLHGPATRLLVDLCLAKGQRALVGKVAMDNPATCPDSYRDASAQAAIAETRALIDYVRAHADNRDGRVLPAITPRFIPACTDAALAGLGQLARQTGAHVQTHCSESDWAHAYVQERHGRSDAQSLDGFGLVTRRTVLAHANFLGADDMALLATRGAGVAHCPHSNAYFANSVFPLRAALERGVRVGLGTDISGGPDASLLDAQRMAVAASRMLETGVDPALPAGRRGRPGSRIDIATAFHLATAGGADVLDLPVGRFAPGCWFDALVIDTAAAAGTIRLFDAGAPETVLEKIVRTASRPNIADVFVAGRRVAGASLR